MVLESNGNHDKIQGRNKNEISKTQSDYDNNKYLKKNDFKMGVNVKQVLSYYI